MNKLFSLVNGWAEKLTINVLRISGFKQEEIDNVTKAFTSRDSATTEDQKQIAKTTLDSVLPSWFNPLKKFFIFLFIILVVFIMYRIGLFKKLLLKLKKLIK